LSKWYKNNVERYYQFSGEIMKASEAQLKTQAISCKIGTNEDRLRAIIDRKIMDQIQAGMFFTGWVIGACDKDTEEAIYKVEKSLKDDGYSVHIGKTIGYELGPVELTMFVSWASYRG
jgi:biotin operon repressor